MEFYEELKGEVFEGGIHVPFALKWPKKIPQGITYNAQIISLDIFSTVITQFSIPINTRNILDGVTLIPNILCKKEAIPHDYLFWRKSDSNNYACRGNEGEKIVVKNNEQMIFNLNQDLSESNNLIENDDELFKNLLSQYKEWNAQMLNPVFEGLENDKAYSEKNPNRYNRPN